MNDANIGQLLQTINLIPAADLVASADGTGVDISEFVGEVAIFLAAKRIAGTNATLDVKLQGSSDDAAADAYADISGKAFTQVTNANSSAAVLHKLTLNVDGAEKYLRAKITIAGTDSPEFAAACFAVGVKQIKT